MTSLANLPIHILKRINKKTVNNVPFTYKLYSNGKLVRNTKYHNFAKNKEYGTHVKPLSALLEVHPEIRKKLKRKPSQAFPLRSVLPSNIIQHINKQVYRRSPLRLPHTHFKAQSFKRGSKYYVPFKDNTKKVKWLNKTEYIPVRYNNNSGLFKKVKSKSIPKNTLFIHKNILKTMPTDF